jgi:hypothetical protein
MALLIRSSDSPPCNLGHFKTLAAAGAFDSFGYRPVECGECGGSGRAWGEVPRKDPTKGMKRAKVDCPACGASGFARAELPPEAERAAAEEALLGVALTDPAAALAEKHADRLARLDPIADAERATGGTVKVPGVVREVKRFKIRADARHGAGRPMARVTVVWHGQAVSFAAFPDQLEEYGFLLKEGNLCEFTLKTGAKGPQLQKGYKLS